MEFYSIVLILLVVSIGLSSVVAKVKLPYAVFMLETIKNNANDRKYK
jgi:hypothetical protein